MRVSIHVMQRGWVYVGWESREGDDWVLRGARLIHRWGTKRGLPEIQGGPTDSTVLHPCSHPVRAHFLTLVHRLDCDAEAWREHLGSPE